MPSQRLPVCQIDSYNGCLCSTGLCGFQGTDTQLNKEKQRNGLTLKMLNSSWNPRALMRLHHSNRCSRLLNVLCINWLFFLFSSPIPLFLLFSLIPHLLYILLFLSPPSFLFPSPIPLFLLPPPSPPVSSSTPFSTSFALHFHTHPQCLLPLGLSSSVP